MNIEVVTLPNSPVVHLALLYNATPLCGRNAPADWQPAEWQGRPDEHRTLCEHCNRGLAQLNNRALVWRRLDPSGVSV